MKINNKIGLTNMILSGIIFLILSIGIIGFRETKVPLQSFTYLLSTMLSILIFFVLYNHKGKGLNKLSIFKDVLNVIVVLILDNCFFLITRSNYGFNISNMPMTINQDLLSQALMMSILISLLLFVLNVSIVYESLKNINDDLDKEDTRKRSFVSVHLMIFVVSVILITLNYFISPNIFDNELYATYELGMTPFFLIFLICNIILFIQSLFDLKETKNKEKLSRVIVSLFNVVLWIFIFIEYNFGYGFMFPHQQYYYDTIQKLRFIVCVISILSIVSISAKRRHKKAR